MKIPLSSLLYYLAIATLLEIITTSENFAEGKKQNRPPPSGRASRPLPKKAINSRTTPVSRRPQYDPEEEEEDLFDPGLDEYDDDYEDETPPPRPKKKQITSERPPASGRRPPPSSSALKKKQAQKNPRRPSYDEEEDDDIDDFEPRRRGPPPPRGSKRPPPSRSGRRGEMVAYTKQQTPAFARGLAALRESLPDPTALKDAAVNSLSAARQTTSRLSANIYRDMKGLTSSELEQVMLKATRPDDSPVKGKHVERLVGVTYQIAARYDIYDAVLRKLWNKMAERDWRTTIKALYILHRFSADGAPEHQAALKARLRELRRTRDPKRKGKFFQSQQLLAGDATPENAKFRAFLARYAHYVLLRAQCFGGAFRELSMDSKGSSSKTSSKVKPITSSALRVEHLDAAQLVLKAGTACLLQEGEECEHTAIAVERVACDLMALSTAVATTLIRILKDDDDENEQHWKKTADIALITRWCEFYSQELLPQTRTMVKKTSPMLDAYGLYLPSRMGTIVPPELLQIGLKAASATEGEVDPVEGSTTVENIETKETDAAKTTVKSDSGKEKPTEDSTTSVKKSEEVDEVGNAENDEEWEYDEDNEEYYDQEE